MYDSKLEEKYHSLNPQLTRCNHYYQFNFKDSDNVLFLAKPDFFDVSTNTYFEIKGKALNNVKTKNESIRQLEAVKSYKGYLPLIDKLKYQWCHSLFKQSIVQEEVQKQGFNFVVVFFQCKLSTIAVNRMKKHGLNYVIA